MRIEKLVYGGAGLSRNDGKVVMTPFVLAGEDVEVRVVKPKKEFDEAVTADHSARFSQSVGRELGPLPGFVVDPTIGAQSFQHSGDGRRTNVQLAGNVGRRHDLIRAAEPVDGLQVVLHRGRGLRRHGALESEPRVSRSFS